MGGENGRNEEVIKIYCGFEPGTRVACNNRANRAGNMHTLCTAVFP